MDVAIQKEFEVTLFPYERKGQADKGEPATVEGLRVNLRHLPSGDERLLSYPSFLDCEELSLNLEHQILRQFPESETAAKLAIKHGRRAFKRNPQAEARLRERLLESLAASAQEGRANGLFWSVLLQYAE